MLFGNHHHYYRLRLSLLILAVVLNVAVLGAMLFAPELQYRLPGDTIQAEEGSAYISAVPGKIGGIFRVPKDRPDGARSSLRLYEDGMLLGPTHASHELIRSAGSGAFSHWGDALWFSTSDGSDPRFNGRTYLAKSDSHLPFEYLLGSFAFLVAVCFLVYRDQTLQHFKKIGGALTSALRQAGKIPRDGISQSQWGTHPFFRRGDNRVLIGKDDLDIAAVAATIAVILMFWLLRISYWQAVEEIPFSDMDAFDMVAHGIVSDWQFGWGGFWQTYTTPSLVTARALQIYLFGDGLLPWRLFQATLTFGGLCWMAYELRLVTTSRWLPIALIGFVALSQPSIFWSLKLAREGFHEAMIYMTIASALFSLRANRWWAYMLTGAILAINFLNRSNSALLVPIVVLFCFFSQYAATSEAVMGLGRRLAQGTRPAIFFLLGVMILWAPWIARSVYIYGEPVLLTTQGPYALLWELGQFEVTLEDGTVVETTLNEMQTEADQRFATDFEAFRYAKKVADAWVRENLHEIPGIFFDRLTNTVSSRTIYLTKVPRDVLYGNWQDYLLLDKTITWVYSGISGLILLGILYPARLLIVPAAVLVPWVTAAFFIGYARMLEPALPLILFGNILWLILIVRFVKGLFRPPSISGTYG